MKQLKTIERTIYAHTRRSLLKILVKRYTNGNVGNTINIVKE
jgi:hypothetical protein